MDPTRTTHILRTTAAENSPHPASPKAKGRMSVVVVRDLSTLSRLVPAWEELAAAAIEPNVFYEHWMLLPALEAFGAEKDIRVVLVLTHDAHDAGAPAQLGALFPLERVRDFRNLKVSTLSTWQH